ncbi:MAG: ArsR family transcriptional regulator [Zetaproteobacteria bacterium]|nr:MAG: ArsR family transcriptional regulator [Zetaproteobacteria bacterium]
MSVTQVSQTAKTTRVFRALSVEARVRMVELLKERALCVNALARELKITPAAVSQHLRVLRDSDLVVPDKRGNFVHYRVNEATLAGWREQTDRLLRPPEA